MMRLPKMILGALALLLAVAPAFAQDDYGAPPPQQDAAAAPAPAPAASYTQEQIDQMVAPIALYPDPLISQVLMASTYPLEVVEANRWLQNSGNGQLQGDALAAALQQQPWDPSVKSLVGVPQVLGMMNGNLQWTEQLGNAFLAQQDQVMDSVQRLRQMAQSSGHLASTPEQTVATDDGAVVIQPANPNVMYVPYYNPAVVYGTWPYPDYLPYYFPPYAGLYTTVGFIGFGFGVALIGDYWGWNHWDWRHHRIDIDNGRFAAINRGQPPRVAGVWAHDPGHRHSVPYANAGLRAQYQGNAEQARQNFRGYAQQERLPENNAAGNRLPQNNAQGNRLPENNAAFAGRPVTAEHAAQRVAAPAYVPQVRAEAPRAQAAPAFESFSRGSEVRAQSERGAQSRATIQAAPARVAAPAAAPARSGGGGRNENMRNR